MPEHNSDLSEAPKDCTLLWLLVDYTGEDAAHPIEDATVAWTIGSNNFDNDGEDRWSFVGWCWSHDHWVDGRGEVIGWARLEPPTVRCSEVIKKTTRQTGGVDGG